MVSRVLRGFKQFSKIPFRSTANVYVPEQELDLSVPTLKERLESKSTFIEVMFLLCFQFDTKFLQYSKLCV